MNESQLIVGINAVYEAIETGRSLERILLLKDLTNPRLFELLKLCRKKNIPVSLVPKNKLDFEFNGNHQGAMAKASAKEYATFETILNKLEVAGNSGLVLIPEGVEDPQNLGALIRTAACMGAQGVILPPQASAGLSGGTAKSSAGAIEHMDICRVQSMPATLKRLKANGVKLIGFEADGESSLTDIKIDGPVAIILGGEDKGIRPHIRRELDALVRIPLPGGFHSLNVAAAGAIALYEVIRQRSI